MNTTTHLARHMLAFSPNKDAARLCLYHYLIHHCDPETPLTPQLFEEFCRTALSFDHWQENSIQLSQELQYILQHYNETFMLDYSMRDFTFPDHWQVVNIKNSIDGIYIFEKWAEDHSPEGSKSRVIFTKDRNYLVLVQAPNEEITVVHGSPAMLLRKGELEPLNMNIKLSYDKNLSLKPDTTQYLKVSDNTYSRFRIKDRKATGMMIRGYIFQNQLEVQGKINEYPNLYYPLKKIEQYYVDRKSDPDYQELVEALEKATELLKLQHPEAQTFGKAALERGQSALESIFINDNIVQALVDQLSYELK